MDLNEDNISNRGWSEYGRLVLKELERLNHGQEKLREDFDQQFKELNEKMTKFNTTEKVVDELSEWKGKVVEVWSPTQMQQAKNELYAQKNKWQKVFGIVLAVQIILALALFLRDIIN